MTPEDLSRGRGAPRAGQRVCLRAPRHAEGRGPHAPGVRHRGGHGARGGATRDASKELVAWQAFNGAPSWPTAARQGVAAHVSEERILGL